MQTDAVPAYDDVMMGVASESASERLLESKTGSRADSGGHFIPVTQRPLVSTGPASRPAAAAALSFTTSQSLVVTAKTNVLRLRTPAINPLTPVVIG